MSEQGWRIAGVVAAALGLAACGGRAMGPAADVSLPPPPVRAPASGLVPTTQQTETLQSVIGAQGDPNEAEATRIKADPEFRGMGTLTSGASILESINAHWALARGATGAGVTVGVVDSGLDHYHREFSGTGSGTGKVLEESTIFLNTYMEGGSIFQDVPYDENNANHIVVGTYDPTKPQIDQLPVQFPSPPSGAQGGALILTPGRIDRIGFPEQSDCLAYGGPPDQCIFFLRSPTSHVNVPILGDIEHGTFVSGTAVARRQGDGIGMHGVAPDARLQFNIRMNLGATPLGTQADRDRYAEGLRRPFLSLVGDSDDPGIPVVNASFGLTVLISDPRLNNGFAGQFPIWTNYVAQEGVAGAPDREPDDKTIFTWAAGNLNGERQPCQIASPPSCTNGAVDAFVPGVLPGLPLRLHDTRGHFLAVAALGTDGAIASFSNRCGPLPARSLDPGDPQYLANFVGLDGAPGILPPGFLSRSPPIFGGWHYETQGRHYCLAAPGVSVRGANAGGGYGDLNGTSFAAPMVAGAVAVLIDHFTDPDTGVRAMGNTAIAQRILETANRQGRYAPDMWTGDADRAYSTIYGAGVLDLKAATEPVGVARIAMSSALEGPAAPLASTFLGSSPAYGDALSLALAGHTVAAFDEMRFPFWRPLAALAALGRPPGLLQRHALAAAPPPRRITLSSGARLSFATDASADSTIGASPLRRLAFTQQLGAASVFASAHAPDATPLSLRESPALVHEPLADPDAFRHPFLAFAGRGWTTGVQLPLGPGAFTAAAFAGRPDAGSTSPGSTRAGNAKGVRGAVLGYGFAASALRLTLQAGLMAEPDRALGLNAAGAFGGLGGNTAFGGLMLTAGLGGSWQVIGQAHGGVAHPRAPGLGLIDSISAVTATAFSLGLAGGPVFTPQDRLTFTLAQPLRVERGQAQLTWASGRTPGGVLVRNSTRASLAPSGREVELGVSWRSALSEHTGLRFNAGAVHQPGHRRQTPAAFHLLGGLDMSF